jgi:hypothetical protein
MTLGCDTGISPLTRAPAHFFYLCALAQRQSWSSGKGEEHDGSLWHKLEGFGGAAILAAI